MLSAPYAFAAAPNNLDLATTLGSLVLVIGSALALLLIANLGYWGATMETLSLVVSATLVSVIIGVPLGTAIGQYLSWRVSFGLISLLGLITGAFLFFA